MLTTPFIALTPQSVAPGPRITSIRSTSGKGTSTVSQKVVDSSGS